MGFFISMKFWFFPLGFQRKPACAFNFIGCAFNFIVCAFNILVLKIKIGICVLSKGFFPSSFIERCCWVYAFFRKLLFLIYRAVLGFVRFLRLQFSGRLRLQSGLAFGVRAIWGLLWRLVFV